jgi:hypothetical protein
MKVHCSLMLSDMPECELSAKPVKEGVTICA